MGQPVDQNYILNEEVLTGATPVPPAEEIETEEDLVKLTMLQKGMEGESVKALQILLEGYEHDTVYGADGIFGDATDAAVRSFQKERGLAVDGIVGNETWSALLGV